MNQTIINERYRLDQEIGQGGMGTVYRAFDTMLEREVALKLLYNDVGAEGRALLLHEAQTVAKLDHPNIVSIYDAGEYERSSYIVMPLIEGESLRHYQTDDLDEIVEIVKQICLALEHAHGNGIIHRDLKPENILRTQDGIIKLMDFGLARSVASILTKEGMVVGTAVYMPPEQAQGDKIDQRADLYSLGVMMYEMTTRTLPFDADNTIGLIAQHIHASIVPPQDKRADLPVYLNDLIVKMMSKTPQERPPSASAVLQVLEKPSRPEVRKNTSSP